MQKHRKVASTVLAVSVAMTATTLVAGPAEAAPPIRIRGLVTAADGTPLTGIEVTAYVQDGSGAWVFDDEFTTGADGRYNVGKLDTGVYRVGFEDPSGIYVAEFFNDSATLAGAEDITLVGGKYEVPVPAVLAGRGEIAGVVTSSAKGGVAAEVTAYVLRGDAWTPFVTETSAADGSYELDALPAGAYKVGFHDPVANVTEYWNDRATLADAETVAVENDRTTSGIDAELPAPTLAPDPDPTPTPAPTPTTDPTPAPASATAPAPAPATTATTAVTTPTAAAVTVLKKPRIKGLARVGQRLRVTTGSWDPGRVTRKIQWLANGKRIKGATKNRLRVTARLVGKRISVRVVASSPGRTPLKVTTSRTKRVTG